MMGKFALAWDEFQWNVSRKIQLLLEDQEFTDVTLVSKDKTKIKAHKIILSMSSNFFKEVLSDNPHPHPLLYLGGVDHQVLQAIVEFLYLGKVEVKQECLQDFMDTALALQIEGLDSKTEPGSQEDNTTYLNTEDNIKDTLFFQSSADGEEDPESGLLDGNPPYHDRKIKEKNEVIDDLEDSFKLNRIKKSETVNEMFNLIYMEEHSQEMTKCKTRNVDKPVNCGRKRDKLKVKKFKPKWLEEVIDGIPVDRWTRPVFEEKQSTEPLKAECFVCDVKFNINDGFSALRQHCRGKRHKELFASKTTEQ